jgi:uncharacterized FlgJ-related protein
MKNTYFKLTEDLTLKKVKDFKKVAKCSVLLNAVFVIIICLLIAKEPIIRRIHTHSRDTITIGDVRLTDSSILNELVKHKCVLPSIAVAQARIESANYKSDVCKHNKNLFGIKYHKCEFVLGENLNHASYKSYKDNIRCYIHIQNRYLRNINGRYAAAGDYVNILKGMTNGSRD